jgi:PleD family two-component response regulator
MYRRERQKSFKNIKTLNSSTMSTDKPKDNFPYKMYTILIVDDTKTDLELISGILKSDFNCIVAMDPKEAIDIVQKEKIDLIILDQMLPGMTGIHLQEKLLEINSNLRFIMITSLESVQLAVKAIKNGAIDYLIKPIEPYILIHTIETVLKHIYVMEEKIRLEKQNQNAVAELQKYKNLFGDLPKGE